MRGRLFLALIGLTSCQPIVWQRPMTNQLEFDADNFQCGLYSQTERNLSTLSWAPSRYSYYYHPRSTGWALLVTSIAGNIQDSAVQHEAYVECMLGHGYQEARQ